LTDLDRLPLSHDQGCALGLVAKTYFDCLKDTKEVNEKLKEEVKSGQEPYKWFPHAKNRNLNKSLETTKTMWKAVLAGNEIAGKDSKETKVFEDADGWLNDKW
jgi:hypothetical protein